MPWSLLYRSPQVTTKSLQALSGPLGEWFSREGGLTRKYKPRISPQGSFRLGLVNIPLDKDEVYDLDVGCRFEFGLTKHSHSQADLKSLVGKELEAYRRARRIEKELEEKHRCWRLGYADQMVFQMDVVPSIPEEIIKTESLAEAMVRHGLCPTQRHSG